jgi:hypothetical protein
MFEPDYYGDDREEYELAERRQFEDERAYQARLADSYPHDIKWAAAVVWPVMAGVRTS